MTLHTNVVWRPIPGTSQEMAIASPANVTLYCGTRGPGKTDTQLSAFKQHVGTGYGPFWRGVIFDRGYKNLDDLVSKSKRWFNQYGDGGEFKEAKSDYKWVWNTGEELLFRAAEDSRDYWDYHGQEFPFIGFNELTAYTTLELFDMMMSCNRSSYRPEINGFIHPANRLVFDETGVKVTPRNPWTGELPKPIPLKVFATTNPFGAGHSAVKKRFIDVAPYNKIVYTETEVFDPSSKTNVKVKRSQVTIFGSWRENPFLDPLYIASIVNDPDPNRRKAWSSGDWDVIAGGPLDDVWDSKVHIIEAIRVPGSWYLDRAYDWGSSEPGCYQLWAEANGEEAEFVNGGTFCPPAGTLVCIGEIYSGEIGSNTGDRRGPSQWAVDILAYEQAMYAIGRINGPVFDGPADNQITNVRDEQTETIAYLMEIAGVSWEKSDKSPGSRKVGLELFRERLRNSLKQSSRPGVFFTRDCKASFSTIPTLPRSEKIVDDVETKGVEDHPWDACRYRILKGRERMATSITVRM